MLEPKILFATDLEGDVRSGLRLATRLAREHAATLVVLHVVPVEANDGEAMLYGALDLERPGRRLKRLVPSDPTVPFLHALVVGDVEDAIIAFVERERVDMVVMETRRRSRLGRVLGRSMVERLIERLPCPVVSYRHGQLSEAASTPRKKVAAGLVSRTEVLTTILNARIDALLAWMDMHRGMVMRIAQGPSVSDAIASLHRASRPGRDNAYLAKIRQLLELELGEHQRALGALGVEVTVDGESLLQIGFSARRNDAYARFVQQVQLRGGAVSVPLEPAADALHMGCVALAGAQVIGGDAAQIELVFTLDARRDFLRILAQPGPVPSAETYAFDETGIMLSNSRFPDQLRELGLLPPDAGIQTPRRLRVCDPGGNFLAGDPSLGALRPLTRMAQAATAGQDGCDWTGYRDYRGVQVVGTWRWLSEYGFGVAAEMDHSPA